MKKLFTLCAVAAIATGTVVAQAPDLVNYQAVARDGSGDIMANASINVTFIIRSGSAGGTIVYEEDHASTGTNAFGLFSLQIGSGTPVTGTMAGIDWNADSHWLEVEVDGSSVGAQQMASVPYSLAPWSPTATGIGYEGGRVGIGTASPASTIHVVSGSGFIGALEGGNSAYFQVRENGTARAYMGSFSGAAADADFGTVSGSTGSTHIVTSATPRLTINSDGEVGIGTTNPTYLLDISNSSAARTVNIVNSATGGIGQFINIERTNVPSINNDFFQLKVPTASPDGFQFIELERGTTVEWSVEGDGKTSIGGSNPQADLDIKQTDDVPNTGDGGIRLEEAGGTNRWQFGIAGTNNLWFAYNGTLESWIATDGTYNTSDMHMKENITPAGNVLPKLEQLTAYNYNFKEGTGKKTTFGVLAQEIEPLFPEVVDEQAGSYGVNYGALSVVAIKAIQEQQGQIEAQQAEIDALKAEIEALKEMIRN